MYKTLFNLNIYHSYFLDDGENKFFSDDDFSSLSNDFFKRIDHEYNLNDFLEIIPTQQTKIKLKNHRLIIRLHHKGLRILVETNSYYLKSPENTISYSPVIPLEDLELTFYLKIKDPLFYNYSNIIDNEKSQFYFLSNINSNAANIFESDKKLMFLEKFLLDREQIEEFVNELEAVFQGSEKNEVLTRSYKNRGFLGVFKIKIYKDTVFKMLKTNEVKPYSNQNEIIFKSCLLDDYPDFNICIDNRATFWEYKDLNRRLIMITKTPKPLTKRGRIEITKQDLIREPDNDYFFPNATPDHIKRGVNGYYSEILI